MLIKFRCQQCDQQLQAPEDKIGYQTTCPKCAAKVRVTGIRDEQIYFECAFCSKLLKAPVVNMGTAASCSKCQKQIVIPGANGKPAQTHSHQPAEQIRQDTNTGYSNGANKKMSWFQWVFDGNSKEQKFSSIKAENLLSDIESVLHEYDFVKSDVDQQLKKEIRRLHDETVSEHLRTISIDRIAEMVSGVRLESLKSAGYSNIEAVRDCRKSDFKRFDGIGEKSATKIHSAVTQLVQNIKSQPFKLPLPDNAQEQHHSLLAAAFSKRRIDRIPAHTLSQLLEKRTQIESKLLQLQSANGFINRLFDRTRTEAALNAIRLDLDSLCRSSNSMSERQQIREAIADSRPPVHFQNLINDYRSNFADYAAVLEKVSDQQVSASHQRQRGRQGGIPSAIADAVESVQLKVDDLDINLRAYQEFGIKYLVHQGRTVLGDEMGLGKTIQALGAALHCKAVEGAQRFLIVAPASILGNWEREIRNRTNEKIHLLHGKHRDSSARFWASEGGFGLTSYSTLRSMYEVQAASPDFLIVDESHYVKNPDAKRSKMISKLAESSQRMVLMSGTPLENRVDEFINLIRICDKELASSVRSFGGGALSPDAFERKIAPVYLRRNQEDVLHELPEVVETEEWVTMTPEDWQAYDRGFGNANIMTLRQAANGFTHNSAKMTRLSELVAYYREVGKKVVIFSYFKNTLTIVGEIVGEHFRIDGGVSPSQRMELIDEFSNSLEWSALISQIEAGGVGLNLQAASVVILVEPQFKPTTEWQAIKRVHRMGQTNRVIVHRLYASDTVDERLRKLIGGKALVFDDYARESAVKSASAAAVDDSDSTLKKKIMDLEVERYNSRQIAS